MKDIISDSELYKTSGIQMMNFNTVFQLFETKESEREVYDVADKVILMPDLFGYLLTGKIYAEKTMASTTQLLDPHTKEWNFALIEKLGLKKELFPKLINPGECVGEIKAEIHIQNKRKQRVLRTYLQVLP